MPETTNIGEITIRKKRPPESNARIHQTPDLTKGGPVFPIESITRGDELDSAISKRSLAYLVALTAAICTCAIAFSVYRVFELVGKALGRAL